MSEPLPKSFTNDLRRLLFPQFKQFVNAHGSKYGFVINEPADVDTVIFQIADMFENPETRKMFLHSVERRLYGMVDHFMRVQFPGNYGNCCFVHGNGIKI